MNCPKCGQELGEGKAYCSNPACGAVVAPAAPPATRTLKFRKELKFNLVFDFVNLARLGALLIVILAAIYVYLSCQR